MVVAPRTGWGFFRGEKANSTATIRARAFEDLCERLTVHSSRLRILDFGAAPGIFDFFVQLGCAQYIVADVSEAACAVPTRTPSVSSLSPLPGLRDNSTSCTSSLSSLPGLRDNSTSCTSSLSPLPGLRDICTSSTLLTQNDPGLEKPVVFDPGWFHAGQKLDALLVWDLLNYVPETTSRSWFEQLAPHCHDKTYAYVVLMQQPGMAARPARFRILDKTQMRVSSTVEPMPSPRLSQYQLSKIMPGFVVYRSFLLQNGMQEYVLKFKGA